MKIIILPLTKGPHTHGRVGLTSLQDWFSGCKKAVALEQKLLKEGHAPEILVLSDFHIKGDESEASVYERTLKALGACRVRTIRECHETIRQLETAMKIAQKEGALLHIIVSITHHPRVRWIMRGKSAHYSLTFGIPRPREFCTDLVLMWLFPLIDLFGGREWWLRQVESWRKSGKH